MASGYKLWWALLWAALAVTSPLKAQEANINTLSPDIIETLDSTKSYVAIIQDGRIDTYTVSSERFIWWKPECRNIEWWWETYVLKWKQNIKFLVNDNPLDPVEWSKLTYQKGWKTWDCTENSKICTESTEEFTNRIKKLTTSPKCWESQVAIN
jgi:hypothetical protein